MARNKAPYQKLLLQFSLLVSLIHLCHSKCSSLDTPGFTIPEGDIIVEYGKPLEIFCTLNDDYMEQNPNVSSENLTFTSNQKLIAPEYIKIVNASTIRLYVEKPPANIYTFTCALREENFGICLNKVIVGLKPGPTNFSCLSYNYENLTCSWDTPDYYVKTTYNLTYYFQGRSSRVMYGCPNISKQSENQMFCYWDIETRPHYRQSQPYYFFFLYIHNVFGNYTQKLTFDHFANVIPRPPENLTVEKKSVNSVTLNWLLPYPMMNFPPGVKYRIAYQSEYDDKNTWTVMQLKNTNTSYDIFNVTYILPNLKYAHALYDVRVSMRSEKALDLENMWSKNASVTFRTMSAIPGAAPLVNIGSFEVVNNRTNRDIYVYWQYISEHLKNGENFSYKVISVKEDMIEKNIVPVEITDAYARFVNVSRRSYTFQIVSANEIGYSRESSTIFVPAYVDRVPEPVSFTKISFGNQVYELSWIPPKSAKVPIKNYTIYYCRNNYDRPFQCKGYLEWIEVSSDITVKNITVPEDRTYQFAISANTEYASSGMVWASCTVIHDRAFTKMKNVWIDSIGSDFIEVGWKLECSDRIGSVEGFIIFYCPIVSPVESVCKDTERNVTINDDPIVSRGRIMNLRPYTTYMLTVSVRSKHSSGLPSDPLYNTTLEAAPDPPEHLTVTQISNSSVTVKWTAPKAMNGVLRYYEVHVMKNRNIEKFRPEHETNTALEVKGLDSFTEYNITIYAWTAFCSKPSNSVRTRTAISIPGQMQNPNIKFQNDSVILVTWIPPTLAGGHLDSYEVRIKENINDQNTTKIYNTTELQWETPNCGTEKVRKILYFSVRAVNIDSGKRFEGEWSPETENYCRSTSSFIYWFIPIIGIVTLILMFTILRKLWYRCKVMRDVEVKLPPGLAPAITNDLSLTHWPVTSLQKSPNDDPLMHLRTDSPADEEHLLNKKVECSESHDRIASGDSSGCSSGHESVTSSLASGTNLTNTSDSGTEQPRTPTSDSVSRENSLRQRRTGSEGWDSEIAWPNTKGYVPTMSVVDKTVAPSLRRNAKPPSPVPATNYYVLGVNTNTPDTETNDAGDGYVPVLVSSPVKNLSYVTCDTIFNMPTSERPYVQHSPTENLPTGKLINIEPISNQLNTDNTYVQRTIAPASNNNYSTNKDNTISPGYVKAGEVLPSVSIKTDDLFGLKDVAASVAAPAQTSDDGLAPTSSPLYCRMGWDSTTKPCELSTNDCGAVGDTVFVAGGANTTQPTKGYVPHRHFESKALKED